MEDWQIDFEWLRVRHLVKDRFGHQELPELDSILFLLGMQELGQIRDEWTKEEKQDLMHIAVCRLFEEEGYYEFIGFDADGWPHFEQRMNISIGGPDQQEKEIKSRVIQYFQEELSNSN